MCKITMKFADVIISEPPSEVNPDLQTRVSLAPMVLKTRKPIFHQLLNARTMLRGPIKSTNTSRT